MAEMAFKKSLLNNKLMFVVIIVQFANYLFKWLISKMSENSENCPSQFFCAQAIFKLFVLSNQHLEFPYLNQGSKDR